MSDSDELDPPPPMEPPPSPPHDSQSESSSESSSSSESKHEQSSPSSQLHADSSSASLSSTEHGALGVVDDSSSTIRPSEVLAAQNSRESTVHVPKWLRGQQESERMIADRFLLGDEIGRGAFGRVYKGVDVITGKLVALKEIQKALIGDQLNDILREAALLRELNHPNIVKLIKAYQTERHLYFVLEYVEGGSLHDSKKMGMPEILVVRYVSQLLHGLDYLHSKNVVHRDIKGANILLTKEGVAKLADFGSCSYARMDRKLNMIGTPFWMAPEVIAEENNLGFASDIWSLGCTVIEVLTGSPPYWKLGAEKALFRMTIDPRPPLPDDISEPARDFLEQCFIRDPLQRPSARDLLSHPWIVVNLQLSSAVGDGMETIREANRVRRPDLKSLWDQPVDVDLRNIVAPKRLLVTGDPLVPAGDAPSTPQHHHHHQQQQSSSALLSTPVASPVPMSLTDVRSDAGRSSKDSPMGRDSSSGGIRFSKKLQFFRERERASLGDVKRTPGRRSSKKDKDKDKDKDTAQSIQQAVSSWAGDSPRAKPARRERHSRQRSTSLVPAVLSHGGSSTSSGGGAVPDTPGKGERRRPSVQELESMIDGLGKLVLATPSREFLLKGSVGWNSPHTVRKILLFNDLLLVTKKKTGNKHRFEFKQQFYLDEFVEFASEEFLPLILKMIDKNGRTPVEYLISFKSRSKLDVWTQQLRTTPATTTNLLLSEPPASELVFGHGDEATTTTATLSISENSGSDTPSFSLTSSTESPPTPLPVVVAPPTTSTPPPSSPASSSASSATSSSSSAAASSSSASSSSAAASAASAILPPASPLSLNSSTPDNDEPHAAQLSTLELPKQRAPRGRSKGRSTDGSSGGDDDNNNNNSNNDGTTAETPMSSGRRRASSAAPLPGEAAKSGGATEAADSLQALVTEAARNYESLLKQFDCELHASIQSKQAQLKELEKKVDVEKAQKAQAEQTVEQLQKWVTTLSDDVTTLQGKLSFLREVGALNLVQRTEAIAEIREYLQAAELGLKPPIEGVDWIVPGAMLQARSSDDGSWADAVVTSSEVENKTVFYSVVFIGSGKVERVKVSCLRPGSRLDSKNAKIARASKSFFALPLWRS